MRRVVLIITGVLIFLGGITHWWLGLPALRTELDVSHATANLRAAATAVWVFTSGAMLTFGAIVTHVGFRLPTGGAAGSVLVRWIALFYVIFGAAAFLSFHHDLHFAGFVVLGLLAGLATFGGPEAKQATPP